MDKNTRVNYSYSTGFGLKGREWDVENNCYFVGVLSQFVIDNSEYELPFVEDPEEVKNYCDNAKDENVYLKDCYLYDAVLEEVKKRNLNITEFEIESWIKENANSINLASSYLDNVDAVIKDMQDRKEIKEECASDNDEPKDNTEGTEDEKPKEASTPLTTPMSFGNINDIQCKLISTNTDGTHNIELPNGVRGTIEPSEFYSMNGIDFVKSPADSRIMIQWQSTQDPTKDKLISNLIKGFDSKLGKLTFQAIDPKTYNGTLVMPSGETLVFIVDKGGRIQKNENKILINLFGKDYFINADEKNFLNSLAKGEIQKEYMEKIELYGDDIKAVAPKVDLLEVQKNLMDPICKNILKDEDAKNRIFKYPNEYFQIKTFSSKDKFIVESPICKIIFDSGKSLIDDKQITA